MTIGVLLADDHQLFREGLRALLQSAPDIRVVGEAATGYEVLAAVPRCRPDVVILDIAMPELNGIEVATLIRARHPETRLLMLSMYSTLEHVHRALAAGATGYLLKEAASTEVVAAVRRVHAGATFLCAMVRERVRNAAQPLDSEHSPLERLSVREHQVLQLVAEGWSGAEIARQLHVSPKTVETYRARVLGKLGLENTAALIRFAVEHGLLGPR